MLRIILVFSIIAVGTFYTFQGPFYAMLFYMWDAYMRPEQWLWTDYVSALNLPMILGLILLLGSATKLQDNFRLTRPVVLVLLFLAQATFSLVVSVNFAWSWTYWVEFLKVIVISLLIPVLVTDAKRFRLTLLVIGLSLGLEQAKQGWAQLVLNPGATNNNTHPVLGDNNGVAVGMMMLVPIFVALAQTTPRWWERYIHRIFIIGLVYRGISTYSRGGLLAALAIGLLALWRSPHKIRALLSVVILATVVGSVMPQAFWDRMNSITAPSDKRDDSAESRLVLWGVAFRVANSHPLFGVGINAFRYSDGGYDTATWGSQRSVHSAWFGVLSELGYPGLFLFVAILLTALFSTWRIGISAARPPGRPDIRAFGVALQTSLVAFIVGDTFLSGQYGEMIWHVVGLCIALDRIASAAPVRAAVPDSAGASRVPTTAARASAKIAAW